MFKRAAARVGFICLSYAGCIYDWLSELCPVWIFFLSKACYAATCVQYIIWNSPLYTIYISLYIYIYTREENYRDLCRAR